MATAHPLPPGPSRERRLRGMSLALLLADPPHRRAHRGRHRGGPVVSMAGESRATAVTYRDRGGPRRAHRMRRLRLIGRSSPVRRRGTRTPRRWRRGAAVARSSRSDRGWTFHGTLRETWGPVWLTVLFVLIAVMVLGPWAAWYSGRCGCGRWPTRSTCWSSWIRSRRSFRTSHPAVPARRGPDRGRGLPAVAYLAALGVGSVRSATRGVRRGAVVLDRHPVAVHPAYRLPP